MRRAYRYGCAAAAVLAALAATAAPARAQLERRVGVVVSVKVNVDDAEASALSTALGEALRSELPVDVVAGAETERRMPPEGIPEECVADATCRNNLGRRLDADELLMLVIVRIGDQVQIDATWADVASGRVTSRPRTTLSQGDEPAAVFRAAAPRLLPHLVRKPIEPAERIVVIAPGAAERPGSGRHMTTPAWIATGVGGAALVGGVVFALSARQKYNSLEDGGCRDRPCDSGDIDALGRHALAADVLFGVAAASAVTAVVFYVRSSGGVEAAPAKPGPAVTLRASGDSVGLVVGGRF